MKTWKTFVLIILLLACATGSAQSQKQVVSGVYRWNEMAVEDAGYIIQRDVIRGKTAALELLDMQATTLDVGSSPHPAHKHADADELLIIKEGTLTVRIEDSIKSIGPGGIALICAGDLHGVENKNQKPVTYYVVKYVSGHTGNTARSKKDGGSLLLDLSSTQYEPTDKGGRRDFFNRGTAHLRKIEMHTTTLREGLNSHAPHTHQEEEIILILKGKVQMHIGEQLHEAGPGDVVFVTANIPHALQNIGAGNCEYFAFQWKN